MHACDMPVGEAMRLWDIIASKKVYGLDGVQVGALPVEGHGTFLHQRIVSGEGDNPLEN